MGSSIAGFTWESVLADQIAKTIAKVASQNAAAVAAFESRKAAWIENNIQARGMKNNVNFATSPMPEIPHKLDVDRTTGAIIDLGPFPDLLLPVLPPFLQASSGSIAAAVTGPTIDQKLDMLGQMVSRLVADVAAIKLDIAGISIFIKNQ